MLKATCRSRGINDTRRILTILPTKRVLESRKMAKSRSNLSGWGIRTVMPPYLLVEMNFPVKSNNNPVHIQFFVSARSVWNYITYFKPQFGSMELVQSVGKACYKYGFINMPITAWILNMSL